MLLLCYILWFFSFYNTVKHKQNVRLFFQEGVLTRSDLYFALGKYEQLLLGEQPIEFSLVDGVIAGSIEDVVGRLVVAAERKMLGGVAAGVPWRRWGSTDRGRLPG